MAKYEAARGGVRTAGAGLPAGANLAYIKKVCKERVKSLRARGEAATLSAVQRAVAREYGFARWQELAAAVETRRLADGVMAGNGATDGAAFLDAAVCPATGDHRAGTAARAKAMLEAQPELGKANVWTAAVTGDVSALRGFLKKRQLPTAVGGPRNWAPLSYLCFSRLLRFEKQRSDAFAQGAKMLLEAGADVHTAWMNAEDGVKESALYGAAGVANDVRLTRVLLEAGADVNDGEALYHAAEFSGAEAREVLRLLLAKNPRREWAAYCLGHKLDFEDLEGVQVFLEAGVDVNCRNVGGMLQGWALLNVAIRRGRSAAVVEALTEAGAEVNGAGSDGVVPLALARRLGRVEAARVLERHGARAQMSGKDAFLAACMAGDRRRARALLKKSPEMLESLEAEDRKLIAYAAATGNAAAVELLADLGFDLETKGEWGGSALHHAAWHGHEEVVEMLLKRGARTEALNQWVGDVLQTAIHGATHGGHAQGAAIVKRIAEHVGPAGVTERHVEAAREMAGESDVAQVAAILESVRADQRDPAIEALPPHRRGHKIATWKPLMDAAFVGDARRIRRLLAGGADPNVVSTTPARYRPLHRAVEGKLIQPRDKRHEEAVRVLIAGGADVKLRGGNDQLTALGLAAVGEWRFVPMLREAFGTLDFFHACVLGEERLVTAFLRDDASLARKRDENGWTGLHYCANSALFSTSPTPLLAIARRLIAAGAQPGATWLWHGKWPVAPLFGCCGRHDFPEMAALLIRAGASACDGESVYHAAENGHAGALAVIERLTDAKELAQECTNALVTQLHYRRTRGAEWLVTHGADVHAVSPTWGTSALTEAKRRGASAKVIRLLETPVKKR
ncbi:MAG TPA: ankyrin repeat domain-containing protein [Phycisphaerae bacterium]|nr:ankyrin repeat domain-containing protein [Phycisphaerae bacterium]